MQGCQSMRYSGTRPPTCLDMGAQSKHAAKLKGGVLAQNLPHAHANHGCNYVIIVVVVGFSQFNVSEVCTVSCKELKQLQHARQWQSKSRGQILTVRVLRIGF